MMIERILKYTMMTAVLLVMAGCSQEDVLEPATIGGDWQILVGDFPAFEGNATRAEEVVGTPNPGKSAWAEGDQIMLVFEDGQSATLTLESSEWKPDKTDLELTSSTLGVDAIYAPNYKLGTNGIELIAGKQPGTDEYIKVTTSIDEKTRKLTINFGQVTRDYSRLRIVGKPDATTYTLTLSRFTPVMESATDNFAIELTPDYDENMFLYGSWEALTTLTAGDISVKFEEASESGVSYVVNLDLPYSVKTDDYGFTRITVYKELTKEQWSAAIGDNKFVNVFGNVISTSQTNLAAALADMTGMALTLVDVADNSLENSLKTLYENNNISKSSYYDIDTQTWYVYEPKGLVAWKDAATTATATNLTLLADLDMKDAGNWAPTWNGSKKFSGTVNGNGRTIKNIKLSGTSYSNIYYYGFITYAEGCTVQNLIFEAPTWVNMSNVSNNISAGFVVGYLSGTSTISNVKVVGGTGGTSIDITNDSEAFYTNVGGIIGETTGTTKITSCAVDANVAITFQAGQYPCLGGIVGTNTGGISVIESCANSANLTSMFVGGIIGYNWESGNVTISKCSNNGSISGTDNDNDNDNGLYGYNENPARITVTE